MTMAPPEYAYWALLVLLGVPCAVVARSVVPVAALAILVVNGVTWRLGLTGTAEGWLLAMLYVAAFGAAFGRRMVRCDAEAFAAAMWWPLTLAALWQACGGDEVASYWAIYWLALTGIMTVSAAITTTVSHGGVAPNARIFLQTASASAGVAIVAKGWPFTAVNSTGFNVVSANGTAFAGTEQFFWRIDQ